MAHVILLSRQANVRITPSAAGYPTVASLVTVFPYRSSLETCEERFCTQDMEVRRDISEDLVAYSMSPLKMAVHAAFADGSQKLTNAVGLIQGASTGARSYH